MNSTDMQQSVNEELIKRYLKGDCTNRERALIRELMHAGEAKALFDEILDERPAGDHADDDGKQLEIWKKKFHERLMLPGRTT